ncbi:Succinate dehydrogenase/Fumarate reductase,transmembrane subunit [Ostreococcus tauri]|uniref:Succinate dehydrogenase/Fumarate reductase,transmembrane subunit n=2 Tax=Ostreococcus tauri TaxID=70448 RepID=A0A090M8K3_OSTTA|nr:Succinate dehydrogenase/Fumarate reductase,transmembrane subunit [Ostreococcus tauri]CEF98424.1 Succinate dehydrogenase/Fumarate reductase,transmembrane subunit [Ostreococcus tauri]|eukprot:XP_003079949.2 Succinate dehydrogenase/Fumarate reductase,transmembrane subunit [Ostreococcus tauri]
MSTARAAREVMRRVASTAGAIEARSALAGEGIDAIGGARTIPSMIARQQTRWIGSRGVPDEYGQPKTGGTSFLGTPKNHRALLERRPLSPDVFDADGSWRAHYKFPVVALSSITNRVTGVVLSGAVSSAGVIALVGGAEAVPAVIELVKAQSPVGVAPLKFALSFPFVFHTLGGFRHLVWDATTKGIDNASAKSTSVALFGASAAASAALAAYTW